MRRGFGSQAATLKAAREQNPSVTLADVKDFLGRQELRQTKRYAFVAVDIFTKKLAAVPHGRQNQQTAHSGIACCHG